jgi:hypothetical protein
LFELKTGILVALQRWIDNVLVQLELGLEKQLARVDTDFLHAKCCWLEFVEE